jgi:uncharacterized protein (TIGR02246 family)
MRNLMLLLVGIAACRPAESAVREDEVDTLDPAAGIDSLHARFLDAYNKDDAKALAETYTEDTRFIFGGSLLQGRAAMEEAWKREVASMSDLKAVTIDRVIRGDVATLTERFSQQYREPDGKTVADSGYFVALVRREADGQWRWQTVMLSRPPVE